jgi:hypothetical protein
MTGDRSHQAQRHEYEMAQAIPAYNMEVVLRGNVALHSRNTFRDYRPLSETAWDGIDLQSRLYC